MPRQKPFAWSYSRLTNYETCPKQYYHLTIAKDIAQRESPEMQDGKRQHKMLELRIRDGKPLPRDMRKLEPLCEKVLKTRADSVLTEYQIALNADLEPVPYFDKAVWVRCVLDLAIILGSDGRIVDYKTGKRKPDSDQLKLFAGAAFAAFDELETVGTAFWWLKSMKTDRDTFTRDDVPLIWAEFEPRVADMEEAYNTGYYPANPSGLCRGWCPVKTCVHWEEKKEY